MARTTKRKFKPGETLDRFRLVERLGAGAYGQVWLALDEGAYGFRKNVALKILTEAGNPKREEALMREARICGALNHPNVVDVHGVMRADGVPFIIMEYVEGETLSSLWRDLEFLNLRFPRAVILEMGIAVAEALHHAWTARAANGDELRIVHRDLKPANIMVSNRGVAKVADFGIAKVAPDLSTTRTGKLKGTPSYMAPELWMGRRDFRPPIDLWSLGIILWEMAAGRRFYGTAAMMEIPGLITNRDPAEEAAQINDFFPQLVPIVRCLLQRDIDKRYATGIELAEELRRVRSKLGAAGDLLQFIRLVRAGRLDPSDRHGSLMALPTIPEGADDWESLIDLADPKTESDVPAPLADSFISIEPVSIPDLPDRGLKEVERAPRTVRLGSGEVAAEDVTTPESPAAGRTFPVADPDSETREAELLEGVSSKPGTTLPSGLPRMPSWGLGSGSTPSLMPRRNRSIRKNFGSLSGVHNVPPSLKREATVESRVLASARASLPPTPPPMVASALDETTSDEPDEVVPRTQSVVPMLAADPPELPSPDASKPTGRIFFMLGAVVLVFAVFAVFAFLRLL
jgi:serine/threonine-protein kinase